MSFFLFFKVRLGKQKKKVKYISHVNLLFLLISIGYAPMTIHIFSKISEQIWMMDG